MRDFISRFALYALCGGLLTACPEPRDPEELEEDPCSYASLGCHPPQAAIDCQCCGPDDPCANGGGTSGPGGTTGNGTGQIQVTSPSQTSVRLNGNIIGVSFTGTLGQASASTATYTLKVRASDPSGTHWDFVELGSEAAALLSRLENAALVVHFQGGSLVVTHDQAVQEVYVAPGVYTFPIDVQLSAAGDLSFHGLLLGQLLHIQGQLGVAE